MKKIIVSVAAGVVAMVVVVLIVMQFGQPQAGSPIVGSAVNTDLLTQSSQTIVKVASISTSVFSANSNRKYARCFNRESGQSNSAWVSFGATASVGGGFYLAASSSFTIDSNNLYIGAVTAINRNGTETGGTTASSSVRLVCQEFSL